MIDISQYFGETSEYDKKAMLETKRPKSWCKTVSAFANSFGGKLIFGIADDDSVPGLEDAKKAAEEISEIVKMHLNPIPEFNLSFHTINDTINDTIKLNENESEVLELIKQNVSITREILASSTGLSESTVSRILKKLQQSGILIRDGSKKNGKWIIEE